MNSRHFLLISRAAQGHINPTLELAKRLIRAGARVTFATTVRGLGQIKAFPSLDGLSYASFSDGFDDGIKPTDDPNHIMSEFKRVGSQTLTNLILRLSDEQHRVNFLIYTLLLPWAADVARDIGIPSAFLCIQSTAAFAIYHHYFNGRNGMHQIYNSNPPNSVQLQGLPPFASTDLPSFLLPTSPHASVTPTFQEHIRTLEKDANPCVLLNTFDALEEEAIKTVDNMNLTTIGPLIPDSSFGCDLFERSKDYLQWLSSKPTHSVIYVSFGSMVVMQRKQMDEILHGLVESGRPFLWVIRSTENGREEAEDLIKNKSEEEEEQGLIVPWCSQVEVLCHNSVGCCVTHCGWNSTLECMAAGVPVVACPHFSDQTTNAKLVEEVWGTGIKARVNEEGIVEREEMKKCVEMIMGGGGKGEEIRRNVERWKSLAVQAGKDGGSSQEHLKLFLEKLS
ncbi:UDP-glycosyltransferase 75C1-like [Corylus avellana]|uniref:UDP-glycosyltransferase 75C1-like n=1 Tax=Corylus avellana TaxID=13451 RepID=UPI001E229F7E|nr:UDP-glycosyltransferase 75C1-like [Corylus avellana]XP_059447363.1 UDP-glycosyltransferase 75C1-like [Corylus avellana]